MGVANPILLLQYLKYTYYRGFCKNNPAKKSFFERVIRRFRVWGFIPAKAVKVSIMVSNSGLMTGAILTSAWQHGQE